MHENNIFTILRGFSSKELKRLELFLNSPYHNKSEKIVKLFNEIKKYHPKYTSDDLTNEYLSRRINPGLKYNDATMRSLLSVLFVCIEEFICLEEINKTYPEKEIFLLRSFVQKRHDFNFNKHLEKLERHLENEGVDSDFLYIKSLIEMNKFNFNLSNYRQKTSLSIENNNQILISYVICIINYFVAELINSYIKTIIIETKFNSDFDSNIPLKIIKSINLNEILETLKITDKNNFILEIYLNLFYAFQNPYDASHYSKYKALVLKNSKYLSPDEISFHFSMLIDWCMLNNSLPKSNFNSDNELFRVYKIFLKNKYFIDKKSKYIDEDLYRNILLIALRLKKYNWILNFIESYSKYLHPDKKNNLVNMSYAEYYYQAGSSKKSVKILNKAFNYLTKLQEESFIIKYSIKSLYIKLYYDLKYFDKIIFQIVNYRKFLKRNELVTEIRKKKTDVFLNIIEKLVYIREGNPQFDISDLQAEVAINKDIDHRDWLLKKIEEIV